MPFEVRNTEAGEASAQHMQACSTRAILGGEMSANDPLRSLLRAELLILDAMARGRPVIGHCRGGQLMAGALGARIGPSLAPEIGWHRINLHDDPCARQWFGEGEPGPMFQWHEEAFELPLGATALAGSKACTHQAFAIGPHLAMHFHAEVDEEELRRWSMLDSQSYCALQQRHAMVHSGAAMREAVVCTCPSSKPWPTASARAGWRAWRTARPERLSYCASSLSYRGNGSRCTAAYVFTRLTIIPYRGRKRISH